MSWLTQESKDEGATPNFDIGLSYIEEDLVQGDGLISLEEGCSSGVHVWYDNVVVVNISSNEAVDGM